MAKKNNNFKAEEAAEVTPQTEERLEKWDQCPECKGNDDFCFLCKGEGRVPKQK